MRHLLVLGRGWVGGAVETAARNHPDVDRVTVTDPPLDPALSERDEAATRHLRSLIEDGGVSGVINACGRVRGTDDELADANHRFVQWLCAALAGTGVRLVHVGSASEYGDPGNASPVSETARPAPTGQYAITKAAGTATVLAASDVTASDVTVSNVTASAGRGIDGVVARVFNIVGHPVPPVSPIHQWLVDLQNLGFAGGEIVVWWPPTARDFVLLEDVAVALVELALAEAPPRLVNICSGVGLRYGDIATAIAHVLGIPATIRSLDRPGIETVIGDPELMRRTLGWVPEMSTDILAASAVGTDPQR